MKNRLWIAVAALVVLGGLAVWKLRERANEDTATVTAETKEGTTEGDLTKVLPKVDANAVDALEVKGPENPEPVKLAKKDGVWRVVSPVDAMGDAEAIGNAVEKLSELTVRRVVGENPENHERLGVADGKATLVTAKKGNTTLVSLLVGGYGGGDTMVRKPGEKVVYGVEGSIGYVFNKELRNWRERKILDIEASSVVEATWTNGKTKYHFVRDEKNPDAWVAAKGQKAIKELDASKVQSMVSGLAKLRASDFASSTATPTSLGIDGKSPNVVLVSKPKTEAKEGEPAESAPDAEPKTYVVRLGNKNDKSGHWFVALEGNPQVFEVTEYLMKRVAPTEKEFQKSPPPPEGEAPPGGMPGGMPPGAQMGDPNSIPPDVLRQLQAQMQQQQQQGGQ